MEAKPAARSAPHPPVLLSRGNGQTSLVSGEEVFFTLGTTRAIKNIMIIADDVHTFESPTLEFNTQQKVEGVLSSRVSYGNFVSKKSSDFYEFTHFYHRITIVELSCPAVVHGSSIPCTKRWMQ